MSLGRPLSVSAHEVQVMRVVRGQSLAHGGDSVVLHFRCTTNETDKIHIHERSELERLLSATGVERARELKGRTLPVIYSQYDQVRVYTVDYGRLGA